MAKKILPKEKSKPKRRSHSVLPWSKTRKRDPKFMPSLSIRKSSKNALNPRPAMLLSRELSSSARRSLPFSWIAPVVVVLLLVLICVCCVIVASRKEGASYYWEYKGSRWDCLQAWWWRGFDFFNLYYHELTLYMFRFQCCDCRLCMLVTGMLLLDWN